MEYNETPDPLMNLQKFATGIMAFYLLRKIDGKTRQTCILLILCEKYYINNMKSRILSDKFWRMIKVTCQVAPPREFFVMGLRSECNF